MKSQPFAKSSVRKKLRQNSLEARFHRMLRQAGHVKRGQKVLVACSGGPDSVALLHLLKSLAEPMKLQLGVLHYNHGLRGRASEGDLKFVGQWARRLKMPFYSSAGSNLRRLAKSKKQSLEEVAREMRYAFFIRTAQKVKASWVVLGHTRDDQAETVLMRMIRGTGPRGLSGIRRALRLSGVNFTRPLLDFTKKEILKWLAQQKIPYRVDSSNETDIYERNKIRRVFLPWLEREIHPNIAHTLARLADSAESENDFIEEQEKLAWKRLKARCRQKRLSLDRAVFEKEHPALQFRVLDKALKTINKASGLDYENWKSIQKSLSLPNYRCSLSRGVEFELTRLGIVVRAS